jgi:hypothetical protein
MRRLIAFFNGGECVLLKDHTGQQYNTIAYTNSFGVRYCYVYWFTKTGFVTLHENGLTLGRAYIEQWKKG